MSFHARIAAGTDEFGNTRVKMAPRVRVTERVTGTAQVVKFHQLAGNIVSFPGMDGVTHDATTTANKLRQALASRKITSLTSTVTDWRKVSGTRWELTPRGLGGKLVVSKKVPTKTSDFTGWVAVMTFVDGTKVEVARVAKGQSIDHNGERADACRAALNMVQMILRK